MVDDTSLRGACLAVAQPLAVVGDVDENIRRMTPLVTEAARRGADLILFSECGLTGYDLGRIGFNTAISADDPRLNHVAAMAKQHKLAIVAGLYERAGTVIHNSAIVFFPDGRRLVQRKHNIIEYDLRCGVVPGPRQRHIFEINGVKLAILICSDGGMSGIDDELVAAGCDVILAAAAGLGDAKHGFSVSELQDPARCEAYLKAMESVCFAKGVLDRAITKGLGFASCNQAGYDA